MQACETTMSRDWEATFSSWGAAPGDIGQTKCENAEREIRKAIDGACSTAGEGIRGTIPSLV